jgi:ribose-phosphate pyrophosphokinase
MFKTGATGNDGKSFGRTLLSQYHPGLGIDKYVAYDELRQATHATVAALKAGNAAAAAEMEARYFAVLKRSVVSVAAVVREAEAEAQRGLTALKAQPEDAIRAAGNAALGALYLRLHHLCKFREVNLAGFRKALEKMMKRAARDSLALQRKLHQADKIIAQSTICVSELDVGQAMDYVTSTYAVVNAMTFEESLGAMKICVAQDANNTERIMPMSGAIFFQKKFLHRQTQGSYSARIFSGTANTNLSKRITAVMRTDAMLDVDVGRFANGEVSVKIQEAVRGDDVFVVQSMHARGGSLSSHIVELLLMLQATVMASAARVTAVIPYMAYTTKTTEITALAEMVGLMGCQRVITLDLYSEQVEGLFGNIPVDNISSKLEFLSYITKSLRAVDHPFDNIVIVAGDSDVVGRARSFADGLMRFAKLDKATQFVGVATAVKRVASTTIDVIGSIKGKLCIILNQQIDEADKMSAVAQKLHELGAKSIKIAAVHGVFSGVAVERLAAAPVDEIMVTDSINQDRLLLNAALATKLRIIPVAPLLAEAIERIHTNANTVSTLLEK